MPLNCKKCGWSQDHFWNEGYNPIAFLERTYKFILLTADLDGPSNTSTWREIIAKALEQSAIRVRDMRVRTRAELGEAGLDKVVCPDCGLTGLDMD